MSATVAEATERVASGTYSPIDLMRVVHGDHVADALESAAHKPHTPRTYPPLTPRPELRERVLAAIRKD